MRRQFDLAATRWSELIAATTLLTRLPIGRLTATHPAPAVCVWAYPFVGALIGGLGAAVMVAAFALGLPRPLAALWALAAATLLTGALHEDGLADTADGFGGGRTRDRKLAIMRDSRIGSFGALALLFSLLLRATALASLPHPVRAFPVVLALSRGAALIPMLLLTPARTDGLGHAVYAPHRRPLYAGLVLAIAAAFLAPAAGVAALMAGLVMSRLAARHIGGHTGDVLGATVQLAECLAFSALLV